MGVIVNKHHQPTRWQLLSVPWFHSGCNLRHQCEKFGGMPPSLGRQAWLFCCNTVCSERVLSPVLVLLVHGLLVVDVAYHRRELWYEITLWYRSVRCLVVSTIFLYISTSCTDPGYVDSEPGTPSRSCNCCHCFFLCCALCNGKRAGKLGKIETHLTTDGTTTSPEQLGATSSNLEDEPLGLTDPECGKTVIDEGIQKRRSMGPLEIDADQEGRGVWKNLDTSWHI